MTTNPPTRAVLVAVDGSSLSYAALRWAAAMAERTGLPLHIVHVFVHLPPVSGMAVFDPADPQELGRRVVEEAEDIVRADHPELEVRTEVRVGRAAPDLVAMSQDAAVVALGARGHGRVTGVLLGSVSQQVAMHAACPVVVVRGGGNLAEDAPVVVGLDGSPEAEGALRFALDRAVTAGAPVRVVRAEYVEPPPGAPPGPWYTDLVERVEQLTEQVRATVAEARHARPDLDIELRVVHDHPVTALVEASTDASMVVVARRGLGGFAGLLLGSVSQGVLSRAQVPVVVVPNPAERAGEG